MRVSKNAIRSGPVALLYRIIGRVPTYCHCENYQHALMGLFFDKVPRV
jgi:hypothetical protein